MQREMKIPRDSNQGLLVRQSIAQPLEPWLWSLLSSLWKKINLKFRTLGEVHFRFLKIGDEWFFGAKFWIWIRNWIFWRQRVKEVLAALHSRRSVDVELSVAVVVLVDVVVVVDVVDVVVVIKCCKLSRAEVMIAVLVPVGVVFSVRYGGLQALQVQAMLRSRIWI